MKRMFCALFIVFFLISCGKDNVNKDSKLDDYDDLEYNDDYDELEYNDDYDELEYFDDSNDEQNKIITDIKYEYEALEYEDIFLDDAIKFSVDIIDSYKGKKVIAYDCVFGFSYPDVVYIDGYKTIIFSDYDDNFMIKLDEEQYRKYRELILEMVENDNLYHVYFVFVLEEIENYIFGIKGNLDFEAHITPDGYEYDFEDYSSFYTDIEDSAFDSLRCVKGTMVDIIAYKAE